MLINAMPHEDLAGDDNVITEFLRVLNAWFC